MKTPTRYFLPLFAVTLVFGAVTANADQFEDDGLYLGASYGRFKVEDGDFQDKNDFGKYYGGLQILPFLGVEASYYDFGGYGNDFSNADSHATSLALTGRLPLTPMFALYADIGPMWWKTDVNFGPYNGSYDGEDLKFGTGVSFEITEHLDLRASYEWVDVNLDGSDLPAVSPDDFKSDWNTASLGLKLQF